MEIPNQVLLVLKIAFFEVPVLLTLVKTKTLIRFSELFVSKNISQIQILLINDTIIITDNKFDYIQKYH